MKSNLFILSTIFLILGCTELKIKKYQNVLEGKIGTAKKVEINQILGSPVWCRNENGSEICEYRTSYANNRPIPDAYRKENGTSPDLSPYEHFDVLHLSYDSTGLLKDWEPVVLSD